MAFQLSVDCFYMVFQMCADCAYTIAMGGHHAWHVTGVDCVIRSLGGHMHGKSHR